MKTPTNEAAAMCCLGRSSSNATERKVGTKMTDNTPFIVSPKSVTKAANRLPVLNTFVAPGLPEPYEYGLGSDIHLLTKMANDTDPKK
jgi:hypothetical protein